MDTSVRTISATTLALAALLVLIGCSTYQPTNVGAVSAGDFGFARAEVLQRVPPSPNNPDYFLETQKLLMMAMADGLHEPVRPLADELYKTLRTQGINEGAEPGIFLISSERDGRTWKGDPHEQAMAFAQLAVFDALSGDWGSARASASNALFQIRDFSEALRRGQRSQSRLQGISPGARDRALVGAGAGNDEDIPFDWTTSDFELGYALLAITADQLGEFGERDEALDTLVALAPRQRHFAERVRERDYDTVFVVDFGLGPQKYATGPDRVVAAYRPVTRPDNAPLTVRLGPSAPTDVFPPATDVNRLALDVRWAGYEDLRRTKSGLGNALLTAGAVTAVAGDSDTTSAIGAGLIAYGLIQKSTAAADERHNELLPQRTYIALASLGDGLHNVHFSIEGRPEAALTLPAVPGPPAGGAILHYVRLPGGGPVRPGPWATSGEIHYANDVTGHSTTGPTLPFILGGRDVRTPTAEAVRDYHAAGLPTSYDVNDLRDWYRAEGIVIAERGRTGALGPHILEGGNVLFTPLPGSTGFARLYGRLHPPYRQRSPELRAIAAELRHPLASSD